MLILRGDEMKQELAVEEERIRKAEEVISEIEKMANSAAGQGMRRFGQYQQ